MSDPREEQFRKLVAQFPNSPLGYFSLGKLYVDRRQYAQALEPLEKATALDPSYAAALVTLGEAYAGAGKSEQAKEAWGRAKQRALEQNHHGLADEIDEKLNDL